jgi:hypothetical protein
MAAAPVRLPRGDRRRPVDLESRDDPDRQGGGLATLRALDDIDGLRADENAVAAFRRSQADQQTADAS